MTDYVRNRYYQELSPYERCVIDVLAGKMLIEGKRTTGYPELENHLQAFTNLRDVLLAVGGMRSIGHTLADEAHPYHGILANCQNQLRFISR